MEKVKTRENLNPEFAHETPPPLSLTGGRPLAGILHRKVPEAGPAAVSGYDNSPETGKEEIEIRRGSSEA